MNIQTPKNKKENNLKIKNGCQKALQKQRFTINQSTKITGNHNSYQPQNQIFFYQKTLPALNHSNYLRVEYNPQLWNKLRTLF
jgi:hypothetical protein